MDILESTEPTFRYHWRWGPNDPAYLAATRVAVFHLRPGDFAARCTAFVRDCMDGELALNGEPGTMHTRAMGDRWVRDANARLRAALAEQGVTDFPFADDLDPMLAVVRDTTAYHHDMPMWASVLGAWCLDGPERAVRFPLMGLEVPFRPGTVVLFDPAQPHALLRPGQTQFDPQDCPQPENVVFVSFSVAKEGTMAGLLNAQTFDPVAHADVRHTVPQYRACRTTGTVQFR